MYTYLIKENNCVEIFVDGSENPSFLQDAYPNGDSFDSKEEAESWALSYIDLLENRTTLMPKEGKDVDAKSKPSSEEILLGLKKLSESLGDETPQHVIDQIRYLEAL